MFQKLKGKVLCALMFLVLTPLFVFLFNNEKRKIFILPANETALSFSDTITKELNISNVPTKEDNLPNSQVEQLPDNQEDVPGNVTADVKIKTILFYHVYTKKPFVKEGQTVYELKCPYDKSCLIYEKRESLPIEQYDAIIFRDNVIMPDHLKRRSHNQRYILWEMEAPSRLRKRHGTYLNSIGFKNFFNWTMTYRTESDIVCKRVKIIPRNSRPEIYDNLDMAKDKTGFAVWVVSNCNPSSGRGALVKELQKYIPVQIYGLCGTHMCPDEYGAPKSKECLKDVSRKYKFYLAFENSLCKDYATEKFFDRLKQGIIPVVYGFADYAAEAPPYSYIDAIKFKSVKDLADYLIYLDKNDTAYNEYFSWRKDYAVIGPESWWCSLCEKLYSDKKPQMYKNMEEWFIEQAHCVEPIEGQYYLNP